MPRTALTLTFLVLAVPAMSAQDVTVIGQVRDQQSRESLAGVRVAGLSGTGDTRTGRDGRFILRGRSDTLRLTLSASGYETRRLVRLVAGADSADLGIIWMRPEVRWEEESGWIELAPQQLGEEDAGEAAQILLRARQDIFLNRASFDFSAGFFRVRGFDSRESTLFFNGVPMNRADDGRPGWSSLGGLTDIARNRVYSPGQAYSRQGFGGMLGITDIRTNPSLLRPGLRLTASVSNRGYRNRLMATYNSGMNASGLGYLISVGRRVGASGFFRGTPYRSLAAHAGVEWQPAPEHALLAGLLYSDTQRGQSAAVTREVHQLGGHRYNPHWGWSGGKVRSGRRKLESEPLAFATYNYRGRKWNWIASMGYQRVNRVRTRLSYFDAANPDPVYYRNLPSFYFNNPIGPNFSNAQRAREAFVAQPQVDWETIYRANNNPRSDGRARYLLSGDFIRGGYLNVRSTVTFQTGTGLELGGGICFSRAKLGFGQEILDLLGAEYHQDIDPFNETENDLGGPDKKAAGATTGYSYRIKSRTLSAFLQATGRAGPWEGHFGVRVGRTRTGRHGNFKNSRYPDRSSGTGPEAGFPILAGRAGLQFQITGRQWLQAAFGYRLHPPLLQNTYVDPREHDGLFPSEAGETTLGGSVDYLIRFPDVKGRISAYCTRVSNQRSLRSYFAETARGSAFFREALIGVAALHRGVESGLEFSLSPAVTATLAGAVGATTYSGNPGMRLYYYPEEDLPEGLPAEGEWDLGKAGVDGLHLPSGPSLAASAGVRYRDPDYWWLDIRANYMGQQYEGPAMIRYVREFERYPDTGKADPEDAALLGGIRRQRPLPDYYLLNLSIGKSWLFSGNYIGVFAGFNNLFNTVHVTGGYQQSRLANLPEFIKDRESGRPSFGPRHWYGYGRTYYLNITWSF